MITLLIKIWKYDLLNFKHKLFTIYIQPLLLIINVMY